MKKLYLLISLIILLSGCTSCLTVATYGVNHYPDNQTINITIGVKCGKINSGIIHYEIFDNYTQLNSLQGDINFKGIIAEPDTYTYFNLTINTSNTQLRPYSYYKLKLYFPKDIYVSESFYAQMPENKCILIPQTGPCKGFITKYYFNQTTNNCQEFTYGGCRGVKPFENLQECQENCENIN
jgi:tellurite resistance-related uncharacterized protein